MAKKNILANNPLFNTVGEGETPATAPRSEATEDTATAQKASGRPRNDGLRSREKGDSATVAGLPEGWTRGSFIMTEAAFNFILDYSYTKRLNKKEAISEIIEGFARLYAEDTANEKLLRDPKRK